MKVVVVTNTYPPGDVSGVGTLVAALAGRLAAEGNAVAVITRRAAAGDPHAVPIGGGKLLFPLRALVAWLRRPEAATAEVVHVHESDGVLVALALRLARLLRRRRGAAVLLATLQVSYRRERLAVRPVASDGRVLSRPTPGERLFASGRAPLLALAGRLTARLADRVVAPSEQTAGELRDDYGARDVVVIPNGVPLPPAAQPPAERAAPVILYGGRLRTRKGVAVLLAAFAEARRATPALLELAGDGEQRGALERQAAALGVADAVRFLGALPPAAMAARLAAADVFCLPSLYEGLPLALLEAMAAGRAVVATRVSGHPEAIEDGVSGLLVPPADAGALAAALRRLLADEPLRRRLGEAARRRVEERFTIERVVAAHLCLYRSPSA